MKLRAERKAGGSLGEVLHRGKKLPRLGNLGIRRAQPQRWQLQACFPDPGQQNATRVNILGGRKIRSMIFLAYHD